MLYDYNASATWSYDAEGRVTYFNSSGSPNNYFYCDGVGHRVEQSINGTVRVYAYDNSGHENTAGTSGFAGWTFSELYMAGMHVSTYVNSSTYFSHNDHLGSLRTQTDPTGNTNGTYFRNLPFGDWYDHGTEGWLGFTGDLLDDPGSLTFHTPNRQYNEKLGSWTRPDPAGLAAVNPTNPQTRNRYAYVENSPNSFTDPSGLCPGCDNGRQPHYLMLDARGSAWGGCYAGVDCTTFMTDGMATRDNPMAEGEEVYQAQVDCAFNPGSCRNGVPGTPGGPVLVPGGAIYGSYSNEYEKVSDIFLGTVSAFSVPQEIWDVYANAATNAVWHWWDQHAYYRSGLTEEDARANELAYRVSMDTMNIFTPCDGLQVGSILLGAEATPWLGEAVGKVAYFAGNAGALASLGCD